MTRVVRVRTASRLHFGMFGFGQADRPQFGGVGAMVEPPGVSLAIRAARTFSVEGPLAERAVAFARRAFSEWRLNQQPQCRVQIENAPPSHVGLGIGTQLGLAVVAGLNRFLERDEPTAADLAQWAGRGARSSVGTHGFLHGGFIVDGGKCDEGLGRLESRLSLPEKWRLVLIRAATKRGVSGQSEAEAFSSLAPVPQSTTNELHQLVATQMIPALERGRCELFGEAIYQYGVTAGNCFAAVQGGPFANRDIQELVAAIRGHGVSGVGQSSWGPTVFAIVPDDASAAKLVEWLLSEKTFADCQTTVAAPNNEGARVECA